MIQFFSCITVLLTIFEKSLVRRHKRYRQEDYAENVCNCFHEADALMKPFMIKNYNSLSHHYAIELSFYEPRPTCSEFNPTCLSPYLYCDTESNRCLSKIKPSGNYTGFEGTDILQIWMHSVAVKYCPNQICLNCKYKINWVVL